MARVIDGASLSSRADTMRCSERSSRASDLPKWPPLLLLPEGDLGLKSAALSLTNLVNIFCMFEISPLRSSSTCQIGR